MGDWSDIGGFSLLSLEGEQVYFPAGKACLPACPPFFLPLLLGFNLPTKGNPPGNPNSVSQNAVTLVVGFATRAYDSLLGDNECSSISYP